MLNIITEFTDHGLRTRLETMDEKIDGQVHAVMEYQAEKGKSYMKTTAPWTDRTGNARQGLDTKVGWGDKTHSISFFHRVKYGIFLEVRWAGRFAVIRPTIERFGPDTMRLLSKLFSRLGGGMP